MSFAIGELVELKSGGPNMTVTSISKSPDRADVFVCQWIDKDHRAQTGTYPAEALVREPAKKPGPKPPPPPLPSGRTGGGTDWMA